MFFLAVDLLFGILLEPFRWKIWKKRYRKLGPFWETSKLEKMHPYKAVVKVLLSDLDQKVIQHGAKIHWKSIKRGSKKTPENTKYGIECKILKMDPKIEAKLEPKGVTNLTFSGPLFGTQIGAARGGIVEHFRELFVSILGGLFGEKCTLCSRC